MTQAEETDGQLVGRIRGGDPDAFELLIERYRSRIYRLAMRFTRNTSDAEEVLQEVSLTVFRKLDKFEGKSSFSTWIYRVAVNTSLMKLRDRKPVEMVSLEELHEDLPYDDSGPGLAPDDHLITEESLARIESAMEGLPYEYKTTLILRDIEGFSTEETAEIMDLTVAAVKSRLHRARNFLKRRLLELYKETVEK